MKKLLGIFALTGVFGLAACEQRDDTVIIEDPVVEQPTTAPIVTEPVTPITTDTVLFEDTLAVPVDTVLP